MQHPLSKLTPLWAVRSAYDHGQNKVSCAPDTFIARRKIAEGIRILCTKLGFCTGPLYFFRGADRQVGQQ